MTATPTVTSLELRAIEQAFDMGTGYVLNFSNRTFAEFFADLGIDIDQEYPTGSKAMRLRAFLREADALRAAQVLAALLERRGVRATDWQSQNVSRVQNIIARLRRTNVSIVPVAAGVEILSLAYVHELDRKIDQRISAEDLDGAITLGRTMLEAVLMELERQFTAAPTDHGGDLQKQFKVVAKHLRIDDKRSDLDENFKQVARGLLQVVNGLAPIRNKMSDGHARERKPELHHARAIVNASKTVTTFLIESYLFQRGRGQL